MDKVYVTKNSIQGNFTRMVAEVSGIARIVEEKGVGIYTYGRSRL